MMQSGRIAAAIELLDTILDDRRPADAVANAYFRDRRYIGGGDRREIGAMVWDVLRTRRRLGWWLVGGGGEPSPRLLVVASLLFGGARLAEIERFFGVERFAAKPLSRPERGVLAALEGGRLDHPDMPDGVRLEVPDWLVPRLAARFGPELHAEMAAMSEQAPLDLRVNLLKGTREDAAAALARDGHPARPTRWSPWGLRLAARQNITQSAAFRDGLVEIQDEGSQLVARLAGAGPGLRVADYCAGAAGKTLAMAMTMENKGHIVACDVSAPRLEAAVKRLRRAGVHNVERHLLEAGDKWVKRQERRFDRVLVDAPCTGTGTWRRNPDARARLTEADLQELTVKQA
ncbi:MAG TPA: RsmB/NOP family class I SAM-dependent RNA methyltransferase, partial [Acetobacteraceae bacterium]|nr:RsmB/NOP family class I SAM-dependent RNA methyltransferase [Acetobacteraceae bacterium]